MSSEHEQGVPPIYDPKPVAYTTSYANAHAKQRNAGKIAAARPRGPQQLPAQKKKAEAATKAAKDGEAAAAAAKKQKQAPQHGRAVVKCVLSGDTVVLMGGAPAGQIPPERVVVLSGIAAPRLQRGKSGQDEPWAFKSREFLRKKLVGEVVDFVVNHTDERSGREYGRVLLNGEDVAHDVLRAGMADAKVPQTKGTVHPERQALIDLYEEAKSRNRGKHALPDKTRITVRKLNWNPDASALVRANKGKTLPGIVDFVREGHAIRVELVNHQMQHQMLMVYLAGVQCPRLPPPNSQDKPEAGAQYAKSFVEQRLLQRNVDVELHGNDKLGNVFATLHFPRGNISVQLLKNGLGRMLGWTAALAPTKDALAAAEAHAKQQRLGVWQSYDPAAEAKKRAAAASGGPGVVGDDRYAATVVSIHSGDTVTVKDQADNVARVSLASVLAPRLGNARRGVEDEQWAPEAREWTRRTLIGKRVNISSEYSRPGRSADQPARQHVSIVVGGKNVAEELVRQGLAQVVRHRMEEPRASNYDVLVELEETAKEIKKGMHSDRPAKANTVQDLTERVPNAELKDPNSEGSARQAALTAKARGYLKSNKDKETKAVVEHVFSGSRVKVMVPRSKTVLIMGLSAVRTPPTLAQAKRQAAADAAAAAAAAAEEKNEDGTPAEAPKPAEVEPWGEMATKLVREMIQQHDVTIKLRDMDRRDNFIGQIITSAGVDLGEMLLRKGLGSAFVNRYTPEDIAGRYRAAEEQAKDRKLGMWKNWVPPPPEPEVEETEDAAEEEEEKVFGAKESLINVMVTEIESLSDFYAQVVGDKGVEFVTGKMQEFGQDVPDAPDSWEPTRGVVCAGKFTDGNWYRVRIDGRTATDGEYRAVFVDFGNADVISIENLRPITDESVKKVSSLAHRCTLAGIKGPSKSSEHFEGSLEAFTAYTFERKILGKVELKDKNGVLHLVMHDESSPDSINALLLREGLARVLARPDRRLKDLASSLKAEEESARRARYNLWEYGDVSDDEEEDPSRDDRRFGGRR